MKYCLCKKWHNRFSVVCQLIWHRERPHAHIRAHNLRSSISMKCSNRLIFVAAHCDAIYFIFLFAHAKFKFHGNHKLNNMKEKKRNRMNGTFGMETCWLWRLVGVRVHAVSHKAPLLTSCFTFAVVLLACLSNHTNNIMLEILYFHAGIISLFFPIFFFLR